MKKTQTTRRTSAASQYMLVGSQVPPVQVLKHALLCVTREPGRKWGDPESPSAGYPLTDLPKVARMAALLNGSSKCHFCGKARTPVPAAELLTFHPAYPVCECVAQMFTEAHDWIEGWQTAAGFEQLRSELFAGKIDPKEVVYQVQCRGCKKAVSFSVEQVVAQTLAARKSDPSAKPVRNTACWPCRWNWRESYNRKRVTPAKTAEARGQKAPQAKRPAKSSLPLTATLTERLQATMKAQAPATVPVTAPAPADTAAAAAFDLETEVMVAEAAGPLASAPTPAPTSPEVEVSAATLASNLELWKQQQASRAAKPRVNGKKARKAARAAAHGAIPKQPELAAVEAKVAADKAITAAVAVEPTPLTPAEGVSA